MNTDKQGTRIQAQNFFNQMRASGYTSRQIIGMATELLDLVTEDIRGVEKSVAQVTPEVRADYRQEA